MSYKPLRLACLFVPRGCPRSPVWEAFAQESEIKRSGEGRRAEAKSQFGVKGSRSSFSCSKTVSSKAGSHVAQAS